MWTEIRFGAAAVLLILGLFVLCSGVLGVFRFRDTLQRMHAAAVNDTLGAGCVLLSLILAEGSRAVSLKFLLVLVILGISSPLSSHLLAGMEIRRRAREEKEAGS